MNLVLVHRSAQYIFVELNYTCVCVCLCVRTPNLYLHTPIFSYHCEKKSILSFMWNTFELTATCNRPETQASRTPLALACLPRRRSVSHRSGCLDRTSQKPTVTAGNHSCPGRPGGRGLGVSLTAAGAGCGRWLCADAETNWRWEHKNGLARYSEEPAENLLRENGNYRTHYSVGTKRILTFNFTFKGLFFVKVYSQRKDHLTWALCLTSHEGYSRLSEYRLFRFLSLKKKEFSGNIYFFFLRISK